MVKIFFLHINVFNHFSPQTSMLTEGGPTSMGDQSQLKDQRTF
jgi:hypothetical protein